MNNQKGIINTNNRIFDIIKGAIVTIVGTGWYNGETWYITKECGDIPAVFVDDYKEVA